jgi:hypothetical protein
MTADEKWKKVEEVFQKLRWGLKLDNTELELFLDEEFRKLLSEKLERYPHEWI